MIRQEYQIDATRAVPGGCIAASRGGTRQRFRGVLVIPFVAGLVAVAPQLNGADGTPSEVEHLRELLARTEQKLARTEKELESTEQTLEGTSSQLETLRRQLIEKTLEKKAEVKAEEREKALHLLEQTRELDRQYQHEQDVRNWAVTNFDNTRYGRLPESEVGYRMKRMQKAKLLATNMLLEFPDQSRMAVVNGRALNTFLELCGKAAVNHQQHKEHFARLQELGHSVGARCVFEQAQIGLLRLKKGPRHTAMAIDVKQGALTLEWPGVIRSQSVYQEAIATLETARESALEDLKQGNRINPATQYDMLMAADEIAEQFEKDYRSFHEGFRQGKFDAVAVKQYTDARRFVAQLRLDIAQFLQSRSLSDVTSNDVLESLFPPGQTERPIAVEQLMACMVVKGYRFDEALSSSGEQVHKMLYDEMVAYYMDLQSIQVAMDEKKWENAGEIWDMQQNAEELLRSSQWDPVKDLIAALRAKPPENAADYALILADNVVDYARSAGPRQPRPAPPEDPVPAWRAFEVGNRVSNKGFKIWWRGHVVALPGSRYRVKVFYVDPAFRHKWQMHEVYEFAEGEMKLL